MEILNNIIELSVGAAFMLIICYFLSWRNKSIDDTNRREGILLGIYFGFCAVIGMLLALQISEGVIFDARSMLIGVGSFFGGPVVAIIASAITASYRLFLGGAGALAGVGVILTSAGVGLAFNVLGKKTSFITSFKGYLLLGLVLHVFSALWFNIIPGLDHREIFITISLPMIVAFTPATAVLCSLLGDMNERVRNRAELAASEAKFQELYNQAPVAYLLIAVPGGEILEVSAAARALLDGSPGLTDNCNIREVLAIDSEDMVAQEALIQRLLTGEQLENEVVQMTLGTDAASTWMSLSSTSNFDNKGDLSDIKLTLVDVTQLKVTQLELEESQRILRQTNALAKVGGWELNLLTGEGAWTEQAAGIYGLPPEQTLTLEIGVSYFHPNDRPKMEEALRQAIDEGKAWDGEFQFIDAKGKAKWIHSLGSPVISRGKTIKLRGIIQDITERKMLESLITDISEESAEYYSKFKNALFDTIKAVSLTVEQRDPYTAGHMNRVAELALAIGKKLGLSKNSLEGIRFAAEIHDLGKISIPAEILNRPGKLSDEEFELIKTHSQLGYDIIKHIDFPWPVADMILQHHERLDGKGYPNGLKSEDILFESKVLSVADVVEAVSSHRPYRAALGIDKGLEVVQEGSGTQFDEQVVQACIEVIKKDGFQFKSAF
jgi:PAS domain S-box-containing protein